MKKIAMAFAIIFFSGLLCKNIYFGPGQPFATFEDAFQVAEIGDNLIEARIDSIKLEKGINWKCLPVLDDVLTGNNLASHIFNEIQQPPYPAALEEIEFQDGVDIYYDGNNWQNNTRQFTSDLGFKIHMNEAYTLEITGFLEDPYHVIELETGENWIGYFLEDSMAPLDAFASVLDDIDMIQTKTFTLEKGALGWLGASNWTINYGDLVVVNCTNDCSFYWGEDGGGSSNEETRSSSEDFTYTEEADYIPVYVEIESQSRSNPTEIGLFVNGVCKGAEVITDTLVQVRAYVCNDSMTFDPGSVEFQLSYGSRSENTKFDHYLLKDDLRDHGEWTSLDFNKNPQRYYLVSLTENGNDPPEVYKTSLDQNYPNPFNPSTTISFNLTAKDAKGAKIEIYNIKGQKIKTLPVSPSQSHKVSVVWNGCDENNKPVSSGIYFARLKAGKNLAERKMLLLK